MRVWKSLGKGMKNYGTTIATIINTVLLIIVYIIGVGITSIIAKLTGKHFLEFKKKKGTYWQTLNLTKKKTETYYRQY